MIQVEAYAVVDSLRVDEPIAIFPPLEHALGRFARAVENRRTRLTFGEDVYDGFAVETVLGDDVVDESRDLGAGKIEFRGSIGGHRRGGLGERRCRGACAKQQRVD